MHGSPNQVSSGDLTGESRDPRFAELDTQIEAENAARHKQTTEVKPRRRRGRGTRLPAAVRKEITQCARQLCRYQGLFKADAKLKDRAARVLRSMLPPKRKRGRPGLASVSRAIILLNKLRRQYPEEKPEETWKRIYSEAIPGYASMDPDQQRSERIFLRERVRNRNRSNRSNLPNR